MLFTVILRFKRWTTASLLLATAACGGSAGLGECPPNSEMTQKAGPVVINRNCERCHSSSLPPGDREGAPVGLDFDKIDVVKANGDKIYSAVEGGKMPPTGALDADSTEVLRIWIACGVKTSTKS